MSLPNGFLDELRSRICLSDVVGRKVQWDLRKSNQARGDMWAPCPFHQEKTASFHVDDNKGFYYCFGCQAKGDAIGFIKETENVYIDINKVDNTDDQLPTSAFKPINVTNKIKKIWSDVESRRQWVMPLTIIILTSALLGTAVGTFRSRSANLEQVIAMNTLIADDTNRLIEGLANVLEISTDTFYSKYDVSNASANLQQIESSLLQYQNNLESRSDISNINTIKENLNNIFTLVNELDLVLSYRISISEVLIYGDLPTDEDSVNIEEITSNLSNIIAQSKVNYSRLPDILEFTNHKNLVDIALITAEDLHGRYLAALRNNEYEVAESISSAILLNKSTEVRAFENSLSSFNQKSLNIYNNLADLP